MSRKNYHQARKGQLYCIDWPEWHVECGAHGCSETTLVASMGERTTLREVESIVNAGKSEIENGWKRNKGLWYCPKHKGKL